MRRRVLLGDGMAKTVLLRNFNAASGQTFTQSAGFTAASDSVLTLFMDFTFTGNQGDGSTSTINNILCVGIAPQEWNDTCCRLYTGNGDPALRRRRPAILQHRGQSDPPEQGGAAHPLQHRYV